MSLLSKDALVGALRNLPSVDVHVPELPGDVRIRTLSGRERDQFEASCFTNGKMNLDNVRAKLVALVLVDESGNPMFNELDVDLLGRGNAAALDRIYAAAKKHNHLDRRYEEDLLKNSGAAQSGDSGSALQKT